MAWETGPKSFDDILVRYHPARAPRNDRGEVILHEHSQCKWHVTAGTFGYQDLTDPAFINATSHPLLQRAQGARTHVPSGGHCRLKLVTNWRLRHDDPLIDLVRKESGGLNLGRLFEGATERSRMGQVRKTWREHLRLDADDELESVVSVLAVSEWAESLDELRERLDERFAAVGLRRVPAGDSSFLYDDLIVKLHAQGRTDFDRAGFRAMCASEGILEGDSVRTPLTIGIRSFVHPIDNLEDRCDEVLDLVPRFEGRHLRHGLDWQRHVAADVDRFLLEAARSTSHLRLVLDAHVSIAFTAGALLNVKSGRRVEIEQRTAGRRFWAFDDLPFDPASPTFVFSEEAVSGGGQEIAVSISLTHDVTDAVRRYVSDNPSQIGSVLNMRLDGGPSARAVHGGRHAWELAQEVAGELRTRAQGRAPRGQHHFFMAAPNGFAFFLGQLQPGLGPSVVYEWDFDGSRTGTYRPGGRIAAIG